LPTLHDVLNFYNIKDNVLVVLSLGHFFLGIKDEHLDCFVVYLNRNMPPGLEFARYYNTG